MINQAALEKVINGTREERIYLCSQDFSLFFIYYFLKYIKYEFAPFHYDMFQDVQDLRERKIREVAWIAFRESAKTSIAKGVLSWVITYKIRRYLNVDSFDKENAERILFDTVSELQTNKLLIADFGQLYNSKRSVDEVTQKRVSNFVTNNSIRVEAHSTQESVRGRLHQEQRPDFLLLDDFETNKTRDSAAYTKQVIDHINEFKAGLDSEALVMYLCNLITEYGSVQTLIERAKTDPGLRVRNIPVIIDGLPSWPAKYALTDEQAKTEGKVSLEDRMRQLGSQVFNTEMMNKPIDDTTAEFKKEYIKEIPSGEVDKMMTRNSGTIDPAFSKADSADDVGFSINHVNTENKWHLRAWGAKMNPKEVIDAMFALWSKYNLEVWGIEEGAYLLAIKPFLDDEMRKRGKYMTIVPLKHGGKKKEERIRGLIPRWESNSIVLIEGECEKLKDQMRTFPRGLHDDVLDAVAYQDQVADIPYPQSDPEPEEEPLYSDIGV